jgi:hypothetical protein
MRLLSMLTVTLLAATAYADTPTVPVEVVHVLPDTQQVLVYDKVKNTHVLLTVGSAVGDDVVVEIDGIGMTLENAQNERFTVYPRAAQGLALNLDKTTKSDLPAVYSSVDPMNAPAQVAEQQFTGLAETLAVADSTKQFAVAVASLFFDPEAVDAGDSSALISSLK